MYYNFLWISQRRNVSRDLFHPLERGRNSSNRFHWVEEKDWFDWLDPREWLAALSLGGPWGAEGCCQLGWTAQDLPPHGHPHPRARSPQAARRISGATPASSSSFRFQTTWCPLWEKSSLSGLVPRRRRRRRQSSDREERETDITTSMNIWERSSLLLAWTEIKAWTRG